MVCASTSRFLHSSSSNAMIGPTPVCRVCVSTPSQISAAMKAAVRKRRARSGKSARPAWNGSYSVDTVGEARTFIKPGWNGGLMIDAPGEALTRVKPQWGGQGFTIDPPHGPSSTVKPLWGGETSTALPVPVPITIGE